MDEFDRASDLELASRDAAIAAQRGQQSYKTYSHCIDCGEAIPEARRAFKGVCRCLQCQAEFETLRKRYGR